VFNAGRPRALAPVLLAAALLVAGCGADRTGGPQGDPTQIVTRSPDRTVAAGRATATVATAGAQSDGPVDFATGTVAMTVRPPTANDAPELRDPLVALDVVRHVAKIVPFGGAEVRGASTIKYELDIAPPADLAARLGGLHRRTFYADVFVDSAGRIRRVTVPLHLDERRPSDTNEILAKLVTVDFYGFPS
jgi:hypothetical protein